jgi:hypothetical protein
MVDGSTLIAGVSAPSETRGSGQPQITPVTQTRAVARQTLLGR